MSSASKIQPPTGGTDISRKPPLSNSYASNSGDAAPDSGPRFACSVYEIVSGSGTSKGQSIESILSRKCVEEKRRPIVHLIKRPISSRYSTKPRSMMKDGVLHTCFVHSDRRTMVAIEDNTDSQIMTATKHKIPDVPIPILPYFRIHAPPQEFEQPEMLVSSPGHSTGS